MERIGAYSTGSILTPAAIGPGLLTAYGVFSDLDFELAIKKTSR